MVLKYNVVIMPKAREDLVNILDAVAEISRFPRSVKKWSDKILDFVLSLDYMPERFPTFWADSRYRLGKVGKYAVLYRVDKENKRVFVLRIVYARRDLRRITEY